MVLEIKGLTKHPHRTPGLVCIHKWAAGATALFRTPGITFAQRFFYIHLSSNEQHKKLHFKEERRGRRIKKKKKSALGGCLQIGFDFCGFFISCQRGRQDVKSEELKRCRDEGSTSPTGGDRHGGTANVAEQLRAPSGKDGQRGPSRLQSWGEAQCHWHPGRLLPPGKVSSPTKHIADGKAGAWDGRSPH